MAVTSATFGLVATAACSAPEQPDEDYSERTIPVVDDAGRTVEFDGPIESAVVANHSNSELIPALNDVDTVVAARTGTAQDRVARGRKTDT
ncbi:hypothetical protein [Rhodococcus sp. B50]|uniref:hypothetical protein n=1 Tax=Rhodococcus sp. B50 TaxID=2682847 RepID=UPI001BD5E8CC|nr:hypothetical protein [Rhodococcus sp. B50]MBS9375970.1 hypothetical protein [Rhodococcus sp. B50]